jgi:hypothetical protein
MANEFTSRFRSQFANKLFINIDEVKNQYPNNGGELGSFYNTLKSTLGNDMIPIEGKGLTTTNVSNRAFYVLTSNDHKPFVLEDATDRRFNFIHTTDIPLDSIEGYPKSIEQAKLLISSELPMFVRYLSNIKLDPAKNREVIQNKARELVFLSSESRAMGMFKAIKNHKPDDCDDVKVSDVLKEMYFNDRTYVTVTDLKTACGTDYSQLRHLLRDAGYISKTVRLGNGTASSWILNPDKKPMQIGEDFEDLDFEDILS